MIGTVFIRFLRLQLCSIICSLPLLLIDKGISTAVEPILILSFVLFSVIVLTDTYAFAKSFWNAKDIAIGIFIPYALYLIFSMTSLLWMPASIYNYIFLALRSPEVIFHKSLMSIIFMNVFMIVTMLIASFAASYSGKRRFLKMTAEENE